MLKTDYLAFRGILEKKILNWLGCFWVFSFFVLQLGGQDLNVLHLAKSCQHPNKILMTVRMAFYFSQFHNVQLRKR